MIPRWPPNWGLFVNLQPPLGAWFLWTFSYCWQLCTYTRIISCYGLSLSINPKAFSFVIFNRTSSAQMYMKLGENLAFTLNKNSIIPRRCVVNSLKFKHIEQNCLLMLTPAFNFSSFLENSLKQWVLGRPSMNFGYILGTARTQVSVTQILILFVALINMDGLPN